jgi:1-aminocyclopropane-1-carboxylate deaminase
MQAIDEARSFCQKIDLSQNPELWILRDDLIHPEVSGNKWRKLKYNIAQAQGEKKGILTFGGAFSNHIAATAAACQLLKIPCIGIIRGTQIVSQNDPNNLTIRRAQAQGMQLIFLSRSEYADRERVYQKMQKKFPNYYIIPEGGANAWGQLGAEEITHNLPFLPDYFVLAVGTGTTLIGILRRLQAHQKVIGISVLAPTHNMAIKKYILDNTPAHLHGQFELIEDYHFGGYAKKTPALSAFQLDISRQTGIPLDQVYTAKMFYAALDLIGKQYFTQQEAATCKILLVHTGGLQGNNQMI